MSNNKIKSWVSEVENTTQLFQKEFSDLGTDKLNWKPYPKAWSIAQNIDHLITINETYYPIIEQVRTGQYKLPYQTF